MLLVRGIFVLPSALARSFHGLTFGGGLSGGPKVCVGFGSATGSCGAQLHFRKKLPLLINIDIILSF
jgi:hypothetical protein